MTDLHIRIPDVLAEKIKAQAEENRRSINSEVLVMLEDHFRHPVFGMRRRMAESLNDPDIISAFKKAVK
jgi:hypothetical protein